MDSAKASPDKAVQRLRRLARTLEGSRRLVAANWHLEQTLGIIGALLSESGAHTQAAAEFGRLIRHHRLELIYHRRAVVSALAQQALELIAAGKRSKAGEVLETAVRDAVGLRPGEALLETARKAYSVARRKTGRHRPRRSRG
jgi:hypothetical protein